MDGTWIPDLVKAAPPSPVCARLCHCHLVPSLFVLARGLPLTLGLEERVQQAGMRDYWGWGLRACIEQEGLGLGLGA